MDSAPNSTFEELRKAVDKKFVAMGHKPENASCDHKQWKFEKYGRYCPCGTIMIDFGD